MSVASIIADLEGKLVASLTDDNGNVIGQPTVLSDLPNNSGSGLAQIALHYAAALDKLERECSGDSLPTINKATCAELQIIAQWLGIQTNPTSSKAFVVMQGVNGTTIPLNTIFRDNYGYHWKTSSAVKINNGFAVAEVASPTGAYKVSSGELTHVGISGVTGFTNTPNHETGFNGSSCDELRKLIAAPNKDKNTEKNLIESLTNVSNGAKLITELPPCLGDGIGIVVNGGDDTAIANIIRQLAPINYARLKGNTVVTFGCEVVKFIRPCPVGVMFEYHADVDIPNDDFVNALCVAGLDTKGILNNMECLHGFNTKLIYSRPDSVECELPETGLGCNGNTVSLISNECFCEQTCLETGFKACHLLKPWEYPVFISATRVTNIC